MYEEFYGLSERPFRMTADPDFLYWSEMHGLAYTMLRYGITSRAPITVITGDVGTGKTTLIRHLMNDLPRDVVVGLVSNMQEGRGDLLDWVMLALDQPIEDASYMRNFQRFQERLVETYAEGRRTILIFDEAQNMGMTSLEEMRMLSNINADKDDLLQVVLIGQPQLRERLHRPELTQLLQRVAADYHMGALDPDETSRYIRHRIEVAGGTPDIFPEETCHAIHAATEGIPRLINSLCDFCLVYGFSCGERTIREATVHDFLTGAKQVGIFASFKTPGAQPTDSQPTLVRQRS